MFQTSEPRNRNWIGWASLLIAAYFTGLVLLIGPSSIWDFFTHTDSLNEIGDFLAGFFAFPAFLLLGAAVLTQRQELGHAMDQFDKNKEVIKDQMDLVKAQNELSHKAAEANYQLALFDKRAEVYTELREIVFEVYKNGLRPELAVRISNVLQKAEFTCTVKNDDWISKTAGYARGYFLISGKVERLRNRLVDADDDKAAKISAELEVEFTSMLSNEDWLNDNFTWSKIEEYFNPLLKLPDRLLDQRDISDKQ